MSGNSQNASGGIVLPGALFIVFIVLKLTHAITWSWWWVLSPLWIPVVPFLAGTAVVLLVWAVKVIYDWRRVRRQRAMNEAFGALFDKRD